MTGNRRNTSITRRRALAVAGGKADFTGRLFVDDEIADDMVHDGGGASSGLLTLEAVHQKDPSKGYRGSLTLGIEPDAENTAVRR